MIIYSTTSKSLELVQIPAQLLIIDCLFIWLVILVLYRKKEYPEKDYILIEVELWLKRLEVRVE
jgi:hypothetical protein